MNQFADVKRRLAEQAESGQDAAPARAEGACYVDECPCRGTIGGDGRWQCPWHYGAPHARWVEITEALHAQRWLLDFIGDLHRRLRSTQKAARDLWVAEARRIWPNDATMQPTPEEIACPDFYVWRMREEVTYRCGNRPERVAPRVAQSATWAGPAAKAEPAVNGSFSPVDTGLLVESHAARQQRVREYALERGMDLP